MAETIVLVGTRKGLMIAHGRDGRWDVEPIHFANLEVYSVAFDMRRDPPRILAGVGTGHWGPLLAYSDDLGRTWVEPERPPIAFPEGSDASLVRVWQIVPAGADQPGVVYAGVEPHALFRSDDGGVSFELVRGLFDHPHRPRWMPGGGGACLHTVLLHPTDPDRILVAMSAAGVYVTSDGGRTWAAANRGIKIANVPEEQSNPEFGQCVHKVARHPDRPDRLFAQNHFGVYRSDDGAGSWHEIEAGLPSTFGFPMVVHPTRPDVLFNFPLVADMERMPPEKRCRVYRSEDAGASWHPLANGLPEDPYHGAVLRDAMTAATGERPGIFFGTRLGEVFATEDDGESWTTVARHLPEVLSVRAATPAA